MKSFRKLLVAVLTALAVVLMTACGSSSGQIDQNAAMQMTNSGIGMFETIIGLSDEEIDSYIEQYEYEQNTVLTNGLNSWKSSKKELGVFVELKDTKLERTSYGGYKYTIYASFTRRDGEFVIAVDRMMNEITELTFNAEYTLGEKLSQAGVNMAVGMGTVFAVLIFLTWVISLFKYVNKAQNKKKAEASDVADAPDTDATVRTSSDDEELQVVIAAAIAAYEADNEAFEGQGTLDNGINVKSYRRD